MAEVPWKGRLLHTMQQNEKPPEPFYYQLATLRADGQRPAVRTVGHNSFYGDSSLTVFADSRTAKIEEVRAHLCVEVCWFFEGSREQYRLGGKATVVDGSHSDSSLQQERQNMWSGLAPRIRAYMTFPPPGQPRKAGDEDEFKKAPPPQDSKPPDNMVMLLIDVDWAEWLSVPDNRRVIYRSSVTSDGKRQWAEEEVNP